MSWIEIFFWEPKKTGRPMIRKGQLPVVGLLAGVSPRPIGCQIRLVNCQVLYRGIILHVFLLAWWLLMSHLCSPVCGSLGPNFGLKLLFHLPHWFATPQPIDSGSADSLSLACFKITAQVHFPVRCSSLLNQNLCLPLTVQLCGQGLGPNYQLFSISSNTMDSHFFKANVYSLVV